MNMAVVNNFSSCPKFANSKIGGGHKTLINKGQTPFLTTFLANTRSVFCALI